MIEAPRNNGLWPGVDKKFPPHSEHICLFQFYSNCILRKVWRGLQPEACLFGAYLFFVRTTRNYLQNRAVCLSVCNQDVVLSFLCCGGLWLDTCLRSGWPLWRLEGGIRGELAWSLRGPVWQNPSGQVWYKPVDGANDIVASTVLVVLFLTTWLNCSVSQEAGLGNWVNCKLFAVLSQLLNFFGEAQCCAGYYKKQVRGKRG